jgi:hypothetical protein
MKLWPTISRCSIHGRQAKSLRFLRFELTFVRMAIGMPAGYRGSIHFRVLDK